jgi:hypothetical protein
MAGREPLVRMRREIARQYQVNRSSALHEELPRTPGVIYNHDGRQQPSQFQGRVPWQTDHPRVRDHYLTVPARDTLKRRARKRNVIADSFVTV